MRNSEVPRKDIVKFPVFGDGMHPFFRAGTQVQVHPIPVDEFIVGDVVAHRSHGHLQIRRVVKISRRSEPLRLLTKADNRFSCDGAIDADEIAGKVSPEDGIVKWYSRTLNRWAAFVSYYPSAVSAQIIRLLPKGKRVAAQYMRALHPLLAYNGCERTLEAIKNASYSPHKRVQLRNYEDNDTEGIIRLWNRCFKDTPMDSRHFRGKICGSPWFSKEGCFVAFKDSRIVGFVLASERRYLCGERPYKGTGFIECIGVDPDERRQGVGALLVKNAVRFLRKKDCRHYQTGHFPTAADEWGWIRPGVALDFFGSLGFEIEDFGREFRVYRDHWDSSIAERWKMKLKDRGIEVRMGRDSDRIPLQDAIRRWRQRWHYPDHPAMGPSGIAGSDDDMKTYVIAIQNRLPLGYCRAIPQNQARVYDEYDWIWDASIERGMGSVGFLYVDPDHRSLGLGAAISAVAVTSLFERGCSQMWCNSTPHRALMERYRRWGLEKIGGVVTMSKTSDEPMWNE